MKIVWYKIIIVMLVLLNLALLYQNRKLKSSTDPQIIPPGEFLARLKLPDVFVISGEDQSISLVKIAARQAYTVFIFYSPSDCPNCFGEKTLWEAIPKKSGIPVVGIASNSDVEELRTWNRNMGINLDTYVDTTFAIVDSMLFQNMPIKLLVDSSGAVLWADPARLERWQQDEFWIELEYVVRQNTI